MRPAPDRPLTLAAIGGLLLALTAWPTGQGAAQEATTARQVAATVQTFYDQTTSLQARFYQTFYNRLYHRYQRSTGQLTLKKPGRMRFEYARPNGKVVVSDGRQLTMWEPGDTGGPGQFARRRLTDSALPRAFSFLVGDGRLTEDHRIRLLQASSFAGHVLELRPRQATPQYRRILLYVDAHASRRGVVHRIRIDDHDGNRNKFELSEMRFNRDPAERLFAFEPPAGARRM